MDSGSKGDPLRGVVRDTLTRQRADRSNTETSGWILIVDDDEDVRLSLTDLLEDEGYAVRGAARAEEALDILRTSQPRLVFTDLMMPGIDGQELLELARSFMDVVPPFVFVTAAQSHIHGDLDTLVLKKPLDIDAFLEIVERHFGDRTREGSP